MRKLYISAFLILVALSSFAQKKEYSGQIYINPSLLEQKGDSLYIKIDFNIRGANVGMRRSISLIPALTDSTNRINLPEIMIKGREDYKVYQREIHLMSKREKEQYIKNAPYAVLKGFKAKDIKTIEYYKVIKYEPWMADAKLDIYKDLCGCGNPPQRTGITLPPTQVKLEKIIEPYIIKPYLAYVQPVVETVKRREIVGEAFLDFVVNQTDIRPEYMNNPKELKKITDLVAEVRNDNDITVHAINVIGYASPEGSLSNNQRLSEGRAKALVNYLLPRFDYSESIYNIKFGGENWEGLKLSVEASQMPYRSQVLDIINAPEEINHFNSSIIKNKLKALHSGEPYLYMLKEIFPSLRKAICKIDFEIKNFDIDHAKEVVKSRPQNLSLNEMYLVANTYAKGSEEFIDLFETTVRIYPQDITANLNAATAALSRGDAIYAKRYLDKIKEASELPEYYNTIGVMEMLNGNYDKAESYLNKAINMGLPEARQNIEEINRKRENIMQIENKMSKQ